jgi:porin
MKIFGLTMLFVTSMPVISYSQDAGYLQFMAGAKFDFIALKNHDNKNYGLFHGESDMAVSVLSDNLKLFKGGEFYAQAMTIFGNKSSKNYTGDLQVFSNLESDTRLFLYQCWYKQTLGKLIIKIGQLDLNADYSVSGYGSSLVNSSFGVIPTISLNMPSSIFAYLTAGCSFKYMYSRSITFQTAFFNGDPGNYETNRHNLNWHFSRDGGWFNISEFHYRTNSDIKPGKYKFGIFYHSKEFSDPLNSTQIKGNFGFFVMGEQQLTSEKNTIKNGLSMFFQFSYSPSDANLIGSYYSLGAIYRGMFDKWNEDELTLALASARIGENMLKFNPEFYKYETALEITYKKYITPEIIIQPDFQYIINPGADKQNNRNVTIGLIRSIIAF